MLAAAAIAVGAREVNRDAGMGETMREGEADTAGRVKQTAIDGEGGAPRSRRRRHIGGGGCRGNTAPHFADLALQADQLPVDRGDLRLRGKTQSGRVLVARLPPLSDVTICSGPLCDARLAAEVMPGVV
jgi:hypothetical protein